MDEVGVALATGAAFWSFLRPRDVSIHGAYFSTCKLSAEWLRITAAETLSTSLLLQLLVMTALFVAPPMFSICSAAASSPSPALDCLELLLALPIAFLTEYPWCCTSQPCPVATIWLKQPNSLPPT